MIGLIGILLSLALLIVLAYRGLNVIVLAPIMASIAVIFAGAPILATYTQVFMPAMGNFVVSFFPLFLLGALFGKVMSDSGAALRIAEWVVRRVGGGKAILSVVLACAILTYGGVSLFVVAFAMFPIAAALFREAQVPKRLIPGAIALGAFTFTMTALPGTPAIQNAIPNPYFGTDGFAAPGLGAIAGLIMFVGGVSWLTWRSRRAAAAGEGYDDGPLMTTGADSAALTIDLGEDQGPTSRGEEGTGTQPEAGGTLTAVRERDLPPLWVAFLPVVVVIGLNLFLLRVVFPMMDTSYLAQEEYGATDLSTVQGNWGLIVALATAVVLAFVLNWRRLANPKKSFNSGTTASFLPIMNTASEVGYGAVIASLAGFVLVRDAIMGSSDNPVVSTAIAVSVLAGITGSASGGMGIALEALGQDFQSMAASAGIDMELMHRVTTLASGGMDALPHNGAVITLLAICGLTHRQSYKDVGMVAVVIPVLALAVVVALGSAFGAF
ncbi:GntP family permease [Serinicoccus kebangsaanensis]|uniref:GntP family permease n=1 Tax=Serinicoccus kebangsaanensis TaxID=2602069 RepID=UPI00124E940F|nr:GntP family permease [Serinicoccus kebangsaanensis]